MTDEQVETWLSNRGYRNNLLSKYGQWLGVVPGYVIEGSDGGELRGKCIRPPGMEAANAPPRFCGVMQGGDWGGWSTRFREEVGSIIGKRWGGRPDG